MKTYQGIMIHFFRSPCFFFFFLFDQEIVKENIIYYYIHFLCFCRTSGPSVAGLETTYSGGNGFSTSYNSQRWLNLYLSACKLLDLALTLPPESLPQFQMSVQMILNLYLV